MTDTDASEHDWDAYLDTLPPLAMLILEQVYVVEQAPVTLAELQCRLHYLNLSGRTVSRYVDRLCGRGLITQVNSCERMVNPVPGLEKNVSLMVRIWRLREDRSLAPSMVNPLDYLNGVI